MPKPIIIVEHLSKKYTIGENLHGRGAHTFRDVFDHRIKSIFRGRADKKSQKNIIWALNDISFEVHEGEVLGIIGRNGAGKSTLLKVLARITEPTSGRVVLEGRIASLLEVGTGFSMELTGRENIFLNGAILGMRKAEIIKKFDEIVEFAEIEKFLDTPVKRYSSGMYVRLAFAVAANLEPDILIVDEVLAVGDTQFQKKCLGKMKDVSMKEGRTVLFVSHNLNAIEQLCNKVMLIKEGAIGVFSENIKNVIKSYVLENNGGVGSNEWMRHSNDFDNPWFTPTRFAICDRDGITMKMPIRNNEEVYIRIEGEAKELSERLSLAYFLYDDDNKLLFQTATHDVSKEKCFKFNLGFNVVITQLPKNLLNEGSYRLELVIFLHGQKYICQQMNNAPSIFMEIIGNFSISPNWTTRRQGILAPVLEWQIL
ncbi:MAG: polysaccharide ABC transporter ATP-binding protein [Bacteroidota bacterium]